MSQNYQKIADFNKPGLVYDVSLVPFLPLTIEILAVWDTGGLFRTHWRLYKTLMVLFNSLTIKLSSKYKFLIFIKLHKNADFLSFWLFFVKNGHFKNLCNFFIIHPCGLKIGGNKCPPIRSIFPKFQPKRTNFT